VFDQPDDQISGVISLCQRRDDPKTRTSGCSIVYSWRKRGQSEAARKTGPTGRSRGRISSDARALLKRSAPSETEMSGASDADFEAMDSRLTKTKISRIS